MDASEELERLRAEVRRLEAQVASLQAEGRSVAVANVNAALQLVEMSEQRRREAEERERAMKLALDAAESAARQKSEFVAKMSHELRTPLNGILGMTSLLLDGELGASQREYAETALTSANHLLELIQDILDFSSIESGSSQLEAIEFDVWKLAEEVVASFAPRATQLGLSFGLVIAPNTPRRIVGDPRRTRQVVTHLVENALKFTSVGEVVVGLAPTTRADGCAALCCDVRDTGCGIPRESFDKLFQAFTQVDDSLSRRHGGTGLGLAICRRVATMLGGELTVESEVGVGSRFALTWSPPALDAPAMPARGALAASGEPGSSEVCASSVASAASSEPGEPGACGAARRHELAPCEAWLVGTRPLTRRALNAHLEVLGASIRFLADATAVEQELALGAPPPEWVLIELGPASDDALAAACARLSAHTRVACLAPLESELRHALAPVGVTTFALPLAPSRIVEWLGGESCEARGSGLARARELRTTTPDIPPLSVLLVEDNRVNQRVAASMLARLGCKVDIAADGVEALAFQDRGDYDLILMDCQMPLVDGFAATRMIREREASRPSARHTPIVALTAQVLAGDRERCLESGMDDYCPKPVDAHALARILNRWGARVDRATPDV